MSSPEQDAWLALLDGEPTDPVEMQRLWQQWRDQSELYAERVADLRLARLLRQLHRLHADDQPFLEELQRRLQAQRSGSRFLARLRRARSDQCSRSPAGLLSLILTGSAAALLLWWGLVALRPAAPPAPAPSPEWYIGLVEGAVADQAGRAVTAGDGLPAGTSLQLLTGSLLELRQRDGSRVHLTGPARFQLPQQGPHLQLHRGRLQALVTPQPVGPGWRLAVDDSLIRVLGTEFRVQTDAGSLAVAVRSGRVQVQRGDEQRLLLPDQRLQRRPDRASTVQTLTSAPGLIADFEWQSEIAVFEDLDDPDRFHLSRQHVSHGITSLAVSTHPEQETSLSAGTWSGLPSDWRDFRELRFAAHLAASAALPVTLFIRDEHSAYEYPQRWDREFELEPGDNEVVVALDELVSNDASRSLELGLIKQVVLLLPAGNSVRVYLDHLRLQGSLP